MSTAKDRRETKSYSGPRDIRRAEHGELDAADLPDEPATLALTFGARWLVPAGAVAAWGARAIDHGDTVDLPADRVSFAGDEASKARLLAILPEVDPLAAYRKLAGQIGVTPDSVITLAHDTGDGFTAAAVRRGGYVYFAAWVV